VASGATAIVAEPATLTGSIGVYLLRPSFSGLYRKLEIGTQVIERGPYAGVAGGDRPFTPEQQARTDDFIAGATATSSPRVGRPRHSGRVVDALGQGRVWLGSDAFAQARRRGRGLRAAVERSAAKLASRASPIRSA
jgi:protease-4